MSLLSTALLLATPALGPTVGGDEVPAAVQRTAAGNTAFALDLYGAVREEPGNVFFSPLSVSVALAMTWAGARTETEADMARTLHFGLPQEAQHEAFAALSRLLERGEPADGEPEVRLSLANRLWGRTGTRFLPSFLETTSGRYDGGFEYVDFSDVDAALARINGWVEEKTNDRIEDLLVRRDLSGPVVLVLTNAIWFQGDWAFPFDPDRTADAPFRTAGGRTVQVPTMNRMGEYRIGGTERARVLELPYDGDELSMWIVLPQDGEDLAKLEQDLSPKELERWERSLYSNNVDVRLPRFELEARYDLSKILSAMGMECAFGPSADFSGMTGSRGLFIDKVIHKAFVAVDEKGSEAAAATAVIMKRSAPARFHADRPFLFLIRDNRTKSVLFLGRVADPTK